MSVRLNNTAGTRKFAIPLYLALIVAGLAGNYFKFSILNADFIFGSIFAMLALQFFGLGWGILAAAIISGYTYFAWNHPYAIITMTAEVAVVGFLIARKKINLLIADALYWLCIGIPLGFFCFYILADLPASNGIFLMTKQAINGIANALVARLIFTLYSVRTNRSLISFREIVLNMVAFFVLSATLIILAVGSRGDLIETDRHIRTMLTQDSRRVVDRVETWVVNRKTAILNLAEMAASRSPQQMQSYLEQAKKSDVNFQRIGLMDREAYNIAHFPLIDELGRSNIGKSYADRPFIPILKQTLKPMLSEVMMSRFGIPQPTVALLAPVVIRGEYGGYVIGFLGLEQVREHLDKSTDENSALYSLLDKNGNVIMTNRKDQKVMTPFSRGKGTLNRLDKMISQWVPTLPPNTSTINLWGKSFYIAESPIGNLAEWKLILEQPVAPFQKMLYERYTGIIILLFIILLVVLVMAELLSRQVAVANERLSKITRDLPVKLASDTTITWPETGIQDSSYLIANFREMADALKARFNEIRHLNESLEQRVEERTQALKESEKYYRDLFDQANEGLFLMTPDGQIANVNHAFAEMHGHTVGEMEGMDIRNLDVLKDRSLEDRADIVRRIQAGEVVRFEAEHYHKDGHILTLSVTASIIHLRGQMYFLAFHQDITDRKLEEEAIRIQNRTFAEVLNGLDALVYVADMKTYEIVFINSYGENIWGDVKGNICWQTLQEGQAGPCEFCSNSQLIGPDGKPTEGIVWEFQNTVTKRWYDCRDRAIYWYDGRIVRMEVATDITERKQAEEEKAKLQGQLLQSQKIEAIGQLAGGVAHDFNNMLGVILGHTEIALDRLDPSDPLNAHLAEIRKAAQRSSDLTGQLLAFARKQTVSPKVLDLNDTIDGILKMLRRLIGEDIHLNWLPDPALWPVKVDPSQIDQILANLCVNARDAIAGVGKVTIETGNIGFDEAYCADHLGFVPGEYVLLAVSDDGCGMDKETLDKLFEPFFTTKEVGKGTGLGLATVYGIVRQNNGFINVYSEPNQGTTVKIYLPRHAGKVEQAQTEGSQAPVTRGHETILLVEDELALLELNKLILEGQGYRVLAAGTPGEAIRLAEGYAGEIHLLMTDVVMPEMNGRDLAGKMVSLSPHLKCLFTSGYTANVIAHHGVLEEGVHFIQKPFSRKDLAAKVRKALDQK